MCKSLEDFIDIIITFVGVEPQQRAHRYWVLVDLNSLSLFLDNLQKP